MSNEAQKPTVIIPRQESVTNQQVVTLLGIFQNVVGPLISVNVPDSDEPQLDGGVKSAMEAVAINTCARLNDILEDTARWTLAGQRLLDQTLVEYYGAQTAYLQEQYKVAIEFQTPHYRFHPKIVRLGENLWAAVLGSTVHGLVGIGDSPREAITSFDLIFNGDLPPYIIEYLKKHEQAISSGTTPPPFPTNENQTSTVDADTTGTTNRDEAAGPNGAGDSEIFRPDDQSGAGSIGETPAT